MKRTILAVAAVLAAGCARETGGSVVALGDSITAGTYCGITSPYPATLSGMLGSAWSVANAGVSGQTSAQILARWRAEVAAADSDVVVVLAGVNDAYTLTADETFANLRTIYEDARAAGREVVPVTILPVTYFDPAKRAALAAINARIVAYCAEAGVACVDGHATFADESGGMPAAYTCDGLHLNQAGSDILAAAVAAAIR